MDNNIKIMQELAVTIELIGATDLSKGVKKVIISELAAYTPEQAIKALKRCQRECKYRLSLADILERIDDERPGPNEAWAMVPKSEAESAVWTTETVEAMGPVWDLMHDDVAARMAFIESYKKTVQNAKDQKKSVEWTFTYGHDKSQRQSVLLQGVKMGRISDGVARKLMPELPPVEDNNLLPGKVDDSETKLAIAESKIRLKGITNGSAVKSLDDLN